MWNRAKRVAYSREWNRTHKAELKAHRARYTAQKAQYLLEYKLTHPCVDCGEKDPIVLDFDHRDPTLKLFSLGKAVTRRAGLKSVIAEVEKCDIRCANCHRRRHAKERESLV